MFRIILKRIYNDKWLYFSLLIGMIMTLAMMTAIPIYTEGITHRMLVKDLESEQLRTGEFPGSLSYEAIYKRVPDESKKAETYMYFNKKITTENMKALDVELLSKQYYMELNSFLLEKTETTGRRNPKYLTLASIYNLEEHVELEKGDFYSKEKVDGVYEAIISKKALIKNQLQLNKIYSLEVSNDQSIKVKIVGVYKQRANTDGFWTKENEDNEDQLLIDFKLLYTDFVKEQGQLLSRSVWHYSLNYRDIKIANIEELMQNYDSHKKWRDKYNTILNIDFSAKSTLEKYSQRQKELKLTLLILLLPVQIIILIFIFMISQLIVNNDANEIAVLRSRGGSRKKIIQLYFYETLLLAVLALVIGVPLGVGITNTLGSANGFLEFVNRVPLKINLNSQIIYFNIVGILFLIITLMIPVIRSTKYSIVSYKQRSMKNKKKPLWQKFYLDVVLLALSMYALYQYTNQQKTLEVTGASGMDISIDPFIFMASTFFVLGIGLLFIRVYPLIMNFILKLGKKSWSTSVYISLLQICRSKGVEQFLMIFMIFTLSIGFFSANSARTLNKNVEDRIQYEIGSDIRLQPSFRSNQIEVIEGGNSGGVGDVNIANMQQDKSLRYMEPNLTDYKTVDGIKEITKVFRTNKGTVLAGDKWVTDIKIMGVIPSQFGRIAWFRNDLLPYHINGYLNLLSRNKKLVLLSTAFEEKYKIQIGDSIRLELSEDVYSEHIVGGFIEYWPTFNRYQGLDEETNELLAVGNLSYMQNSTLVLPYEVWLSTNETFNSANIYTMIKEKKLKITDLRNASQEIIEKKNDPMLQGINGALTIGFLFTMLISFIGFIIYWIIAIKSRNLQFGIYRAMGMSFTNVMKILFFEQILVSFISILAGIIIGGLASDLFIPLLQIRYSSVEQIPPFKIISSPKDYNKIYLLVVAMLGIGYFMIARVVSKIEVAKILKLGED